MQTLYGSKNEDNGKGTNVFHQTTEASVTGEEDPQLCSNSKIDTIFNSAEGHTYVFKGKIFLQT